MSEAFLYKATGEVQLVKPANNKHFTLKELQTYVGGRIELVTFPSGKILILNEEGKLLNLPKNEAATAHWLREYPIDQYPFNNDGLVVGDVLIASARLIK